MQFDSKDVTAAKSAMECLLDDHFKIKSTISKAEIRDLAIKAVMNLSGKNKAALESGDASSVNSASELITQFYGLDR